MPSFHLRKNGDKKPLLIGTITTIRGLRFLRKNKINADCIEIRMDYLLRQGVHLNYLRKILIQRRHPVLLTLRVPQEGGVYSWKKKERQILALDLIAQVDLIDLEIDFLSEMKTVLKTARKQKKKIILSSHSIRKPASATQLRHWLTHFLSEQAFCCKIASQISATKDFFPLIEILHRYPHRSWALMGLGPKATSSRAIFMALGSCLAYGYLDQPAAPGQPSIEKLAQLREQLF